MLVRKELPPNYKNIKKVLNPPVNAIFTYGDTIYAPYIYFELPIELFVHEETHMKQQNHEPKLWWGKYLASPDFRLEQELEAYRNQYHYFLKHNDRNKAYFLLRRIAEDLASEMYGNIVSFDEAISLIKK